MRENSPVRRMTLLPPPPDRCQECGADHSPEEAHNAESVYYQCRFHERTGRWPTWRDAVAHCAPQVREAWEAELRRLGVWPEEGLSV